MNHGIIQNYTGDGSFMMLKFSPTNMNKSKEASWSAPFNKEETSVLIKKGYVMNKNKKITNLLKLTSSMEMLSKAYHYLKNMKEANNSPTTEKTPTKEKIKYNDLMKIKSDLASGRYKFKPDTVTKSSSLKKKQIFTVPSESDKIVLQSMYMTLEPLYKPHFLKPKLYNMSQEQTYKNAFNYIKCHFTNTKWIIEGNMENNHKAIPKNHIQSKMSYKTSDLGFMHLLNRSYKAGYTMQNMTDNLEDKPHMMESPLSPMLINIMLEELDKFMEKKIKELQKKKMNEKNLSSLQHKKTDYLLANENSYQATYIRFMENFLIGTNGTYYQTHQLNKQIMNILHSKLEFSPKKNSTKIKHMMKKKVKFLGTNISKTPPNNKTKQQIQIKTDISLLLKNLEKKGLLKKNTKKMNYQATRISNMIHLPPPESCKRIKFVWTNIWNMYKTTKNTSKLNNIQQMLKDSAALTMASKYRMSSRKKVYKTWGPELQIKKQNKIHFRWTKTKSNKTTQHDTHKK
nr:intron-encoded protein [Exechonella vieirai]